MAEQRLQEIRATTWSPPTDSTIDYVPVLSPELKAPRHLAPYGEALDSAVGAGARVVVAAPPQHGKTETTKHAFIRWFQLHPGKRFVYVTYNQDRSEYVSRKLQELATRAHLEPRGNLRNWTVNTGAEVVFTSIGGSLTGHGVDGVLVVDDPKKDRKAAESPTLRRQCVEWFDDVAKTRVHPGASIVVMATRWHVDDLSGALIKRGWQYLNLKAIAEGPVGPDGGTVTTDPLQRTLGAPLWPEQRPLDYLAEHQQNPYTWAALFQGEPRPRGGKVFGPPAYYTELPTHGYRVGYGVDLGYTAKTYADASVLVRLYRAGDLYYVVNVVRHQVAAPDFASTLKAEGKSPPGPMLWYYAGPEKGSGDFIRKMGVPLKMVPATADKFVRAQPVAAAWNQSRILLPDPEHFPQATWLPDLLDEVSNFTGVNDAHDDQVDALASGFDILDKRGGGTGRSRRVASAWS